MLVFGFTVIGSAVTRAVLPRWSGGSLAWADAVSNAVATAGILFLPLVMLRFPSGRPLGKSWRAVEWIAVAAMAVGFAAALLNGGWGGDVEEALQPSPLREATVPWGDQLSLVFFPLMMVSIASAAAAVVVRFVRSRGEVRQQLKFLVYAAALLVGLLLMVGFDTAQNWEAVAMAIGMLLIPVAVAAAVLRYRLYDIDLVVNRTVLFVVLAAFITVVNSAVVVAASSLFGTNEVFSFAISVTVLALAFEPVRFRAQRWANRVAYGDRATPYEVLSDLTHRLASSEGSQGLLDRTARLLADGTGSERASVWMADGDGLKLAGRWPSDESEPPRLPWGDLPGHVVAIEAGGERVGALAVEKRRGDSLSANEQLLMRDLAGSSASVLRNLTLQAQLADQAGQIAASRRRLMEVQDLERRRMERELDEGAQQLVVSLKVKLNVAGRLAKAEGADSLAGLLEGMGNDAREAITQIRSLARGLYPPLLEAEGLAAAVRSIADLAAVPVRVEAEDLDRLPPDLQATVFFCISEAITNAAKHAPGRSVQVRLWRSEFGLAFEVADQGPGFDPASTRPGSGLRNMADRIDAAGGSLEVDSAPGRGTVIKGMVPLSGLDAGGSDLLEPALHH
jgi:signal transduction histidine kinase